MRRLTIGPNGLGPWMRVCRKVGKELYAAHPEYPRLSDTQLMSFVKRLLPEIREIIASVDAAAREPKS